MKRRSFKSKKRLENIKSGNFFDDLEELFNKRLQKIKEFKDIMPKIDRPKYDGKTFEEPAFKIDISKYGSEDLAKLYSFYTQLSDYISLDLTNKKNLLEMWLNLYDIFKAYLNQLPECQLDYSAKEDRICFVDNNKKIHQVRLNIFQYKSEVGILEAHFNRCMRRISTISREYSRTSDQWGFSKRKINNRVGM